MNQILALLVSQEIPDHPGLVFYEFLEFHGIAIDYCRLLKVYCSLQL